MALKDRIKEVRGGDPQTVAAKKTGMSQPMWSKLERGEVDVADTALLPRIAEAYGISLDWLTYGRGPRLRGGRELVKAFHPEDPAAEEEVRIPESRVRFSGGHGHKPSYEAVDDSEPATYRLSWFQKERINPKKARRFRVTGNSMEPMLYPGDSILVNLEETTVREGLIYVFRHGDQLKVKKLIPRSDGSLVLRSINREEYPDDVVPAAAAAEQITIIGRVRDKSGRGGL
jgi:phage repressor protein C with HTH and peptisase S24 domain